MTMINIPTQKIAEDIRPRVPGMHILTRKALVKAVIRSYQKHTEREATVTKKQMSMLRFIHSYRQQHGMSPSFSEMMASQGMDSKAQIFYMLERLEGHGCIERQKYIPRSVLLTELGKRVVE